MKYLFLIYEDDSIAKKMSKTEIDGINDEYLAFTSDITKSGQYLAGDAVQPNNAATIVRVRNGTVMTTSGSFVATQEQLGGYYLIEATDLNDAIQVAAKIPTARTGSIELRPIMVF